ncbi:hypothetical protein [Saccharothrix lopnurensis]|uniref:SseB family protein n=1 Tax=Saccharothrix lopnurensis TaxID=1670621 RepID=A0ABW1NXW6_9PSEU
MAVFREIWLRHGLGIRNEKLLAIRGSDLGDLLHVGPDDDALDVLVKVRWQVEDAVTRVGLSRRDRKLLLYAFNAPRDAELNRCRTQGERLAVLAAREPTDHGKGTTDKLVVEQAALVVAHWRVGRAPVPPSGELARLRRAEGEDRLPDPLERLVIRFNQPDRAEIEDLLPRRTLHFPVEGRRLATVRTAEGAEFLCVFTHPALLDEFRERTGAVHGGVRSAEGRGLIRRLTRVGGVGLAFNPVVGDTATTYWTAGQVAAAWGAGEG